MPRPYAKNETRVNVTAKQNKEDRGFRSETRNPEFRGVQAKNGARKKVEKIRLAETQPLP
jgi:hypothetical protein